jgi:hypothetical protein
VRFVEVAEKRGSTLLGACLIQLRNLALEVKLTQVIKVATTDYLN